jgi:hypothetical protein
MAMATARTWLRLQRRNRVKNIYPLRPRHLTRALCFVSLTDHQEHPINLEEGFSSSRDYDFCDPRIVLLFDSDSRTENRSNHVNEKTECLVGVYCASGFRCMPEAPNGRTKEYRNDACFFSLSKRFSGKSLWPEIASTKVSTAPGLAHALANNRDAQANADTRRTINSSANFWMHVSRIRSCTWTRDRNGHR